MSRHVLKIPVINGIITNADPQDIPQEAVTVLRNMQPVHGKMVRTFGLGNNFTERDNLFDPWNDNNDEQWKDNEFWIDDTVISSLGDQFDNLIVYENQNITFCPYASGQEVVLIAYLVNESTGLVSLKYWDGDSWEDINEIGLFVNTFGSYYQRKGRNPFIIHNGILRLLPGYTGTIDSNNANTIWCGYIDRDFFDNGYEAGTEDEVDAGTKDYQKGFYDYDGSIEAPDISASGLDVTTIIVDGGEFGADGDEIYFYKLSFVYDGVNESLLSEAISVNFTENTFLRFTMELSASSHNKRITAINVYRSDNEDTGYNIIHTIDLIRKEANVKTVTSVYNGGLSIFIPELETYDFGAGDANGWDYRIILDGIPVDTFLIDRDEYGGFGMIGDGYTFLKLKTTNTEHQLYGEYEWTLQFNYGGGATWVDLTSGTSEVYSGDQIFFSPYENLGNESLAGSIIKFDSFVWTMDGIAIEFSNNYVMKVPHGAFSPLYYAYGSCKIYTVSNGLFSFKTTLLPTVNIEFYDTKLGIGVSHPYQDAVSIKVNGEFALYYAGRLFQYVVVLDPDDKQEYHNDWLTYSELNQFDVTPVSNVIVPSDRTGGPGTGMALAFGAIILMKKMALFRLNVNDPSDPTTWSIKEANFSRGNVAKNGFVQVGETLYICSHDGIYAIDLNVLAAADETPMLHNRISEDINDLYLAITNKEEIVAGYDPLHTEIVYQFDRNTKYAYNILGKSWREIHASVIFDLVVNDHENNLLVVDNSQQTVFSPAAKEITGFAVRTKSFFLSQERPVIVRLGRVFYKSEDTLTINLYADENTSTPVKSETLPALSTPGWRAVAFRYRCQSFYLEIVSSSNTKTDTEIFQIIVEHD